MRINRTSSYRIGFHILVNALLAFVLVNCTQIGFSTSTTSSSKTNNQANGDNYDGKIYVHSDSLETCPDGTPKRSVIQLTGKNFSLIRRDCTAVTPALPLLAADVFVDPVYAGKLTYKSQKYLFSATGLLSRVPDLDCSKKNFGPMDSVKIYSVDGPKGIMLVGVMVAGGKSYNLAFDQTVINTSAASKIAGEDQEGGNWVSLSGFDPANGHPDGTNTAYTLSQGPLGAEAFTYCVRPSGTL